MKLLNLAKNKYLVTVIAMLCWLLFFDKNDVFTQYELINKCRKLEKDKEYYQAEIKNHQQQLHELRTSKKSLETFSREKYLMKKEDEDVYVFVSR